MGVDVSAKVMIGIQFSSQAKVEEFIDKYFSNNVLYDFPDDVNDITGGLEWEMITAYHDWGGILGVEIKEDSLDALGVGVKDAWKTVYKLLPDAVHDQVKPHVWAQYW